MSEAIVTVVRLLRHDTYEVRWHCPAMRSRSTLFVTPLGVWCDEECKAHALDWIELHADADRLRLVSADWLRDEYGRILGDLQDIRSGETLSAYLVSMRVAKSRPHHVLHVMEQLSSAMEVESC